MGTMGNRAENVEHNSIPFFFGVIVYSKGCVHRDITTHALYCVIYINPRHFCDFLITIAVITYLHETVTHAIVTFRRPWAAQIL